MSSLKALDELSLMINREKHINSEWNKKINDLKQIIKQDLERKEQLEIADRNNQNLVKTNVDLVNKNLDLQKEITELKDQLSYFKEEGENWQSAYEWSQAKNSILKLENEELKKENQKLKKDYNLLDTTMESDDRIICELLKEKEQLKNDIKLNETQIDDLTLEVANYKHALEEKNEIIMDLKDLGVKIGREKYQLEKALDKAYERLNWDCPVSQAVIDDLDCENRCSSDFEEVCKECWKMFFLNLVVDEVFK
jgi:uncharacterized protein (DUF3084 family)